MRIAIFEEEHFEVLDFYIRIFQQAFGVQNVFLVTNERTYLLINNKTSIQQTLFTNKESRAKNIKSITGFLNKNSIGVFLYNTIVYGQYKFADVLIQAVKQQSKAKILLTLHNINIVLKPTIFNCKNPYYLLLGFITFLRKKRILKNAHAINVICENQVLYLKGNNLTKKPVLNIPPCFFESNAESVINNNAPRLFSLAIVGKVEENRKDYETVYQALLLIGNKLKNFKLLIIGHADNSSAKNILSKFEFLQEKFGLNFWHPKENSGRVNAEELIKTLKEVDVLLCPTNEETFYESQREFYGSSKSSGNFYDVVRYQKPAIFPKQIPLPNSLKNCMLSYASDQELSEILTRLENDNTLLNQLTENIKQLENTFSKDTIVQKVKKQFTVLQ